MSEGSLYGHWPAPKVDNSHEGYFGSNSYYCPGPAYQMEAHTCELSHCVAQACTPATRTVYLGSRGYTWAVAIAVSVVLLAAQLGEVPPIEVLVAAWSSFGE